MTTTRKALAAYLLTVILFGAAVITLDQPRADQKCLYAVVSAAPTPVRMADIPICQDADSTAVRGMLADYLLANT